MATPANSPPPGRSAYHVPASGSLGAEIWADAARQPALALRAEPQEGLVASRFDQAQGRMLPLENSFQNSTENFGRAILAAHHSTPVEAA
jgi:hypothetical protein